MRISFFLIGCFISLSGFTASIQNQKTVADFQELCAKEKDPLKRQNYCSLLDRSSRIQENSKLSYTETKIV